MCMFKKKKLRNVWLGGYITEYYIINPHSEIIKAQFFEHHLYTIQGFEAHLFT